MSRPHVGPKTLLLDIETTPIIGMCWGPLWETSIIHVIQQSYILCFSVKWLHESKTRFHAVWDFKTFKKDKTDDTELLKCLASYLDEASIVVAQNGDAFDLKTIEARFLVKSIPEPRTFVTVDTLKELRKRYKFPSNKLDFVCDALGIGSKLPNKGKAMWMGAMDGDPKHCRDMERYNRHDVSPLLEGLYLKLRPKIKTHPNVTLFTGTPGCPSCGSTDVKREGFNYTRTRKVQQFSCRECKRWFSENSIGRKQANALACAG